MAKQRGRPKAQFHISDEQKIELERLSRRRRTARAVAFRAKILLACAEGGKDTEIAARLKSDRGTIGKWRRRFMKDGVAGLFDEPRPGAPRKISDKDVERVVVSTLETKPQNATHWSTREMARKLDMSQSAIARIWRAFGLQPHRTKTFQLSADPLFVEKVRDIVGLYLNPPSRALVLSVDEKGQIQALNRTQPILPLAPGSLEKRTHEYRRHGTTSLFAALDVATGKIIGKCFSRQRAVEFRKFLDVIDSSVPADLEVHIILDNLSTHKAPTVRRWLAQHPRYHLHFTPTHSSWLNQIERWFALLTERQIKRGSHQSVGELREAIESYIKSTNREPKPFIWTKSADEILGKVARFATRTLQAHGELRGEFTDSGH